ncbi:helix-turn-helix domain-containing protein [Pimelobacter simplex]
MLTPPVLDAEQVDLARKLRAAGESVAAIARIIGTSRATIYRWMEGAV